MSSSFRSLVTSTVAEHGLDDMDATVDLVMKAIKPADYPAMLRSAIREQLVSAAGDLRRKATGPIKPGHSRKQELIRTEWWPKFLDQNIPVDGIVKRLRDCTAEDLLTVAGARRKLANEALYRVQQFEHLAAAMRASRAKTLGDLSADVASPILERAA
ncbi:hypothetical protein [Microcella alkaliphila]|uniref:Gp72 n=1 Tax=Microcella alkaliphila TaxID=279828 RepID=A0A0U5B9K7_9MICO|nr:hypothetical protein [Microcella alkaliphila]BAU32500.1 Gp72 [Microcella alkaliphila]